jgi:TolB-like protein
MSLIKELKRRNVIKVAIAYAITAWLLIQLAAILTDILSLPDWVPRFVAVLIIIGFPLAIIFTWAFELTPEGIRLDKDVRESESLRKLSGRRLDFFIIGILVIAVGYLLVEDQVGPVRKAEEPTALVSGEPEVATNSIAVLPFVNMSADPDNEFFADGMSEEILNLLARIPNLKVIGRTSSFSFKGKDADLRTIGTTLGAATLLEGSVRRSGDRVRITAQLIDANDGSHLWSETYDETMTDIFEIQDQVAAAIINELQIHVGTVPTRGRPTESTEAYALFLRARAATIVFELQEAEELLKQAIGLDPNFAEAWEMLASVYWAGPPGNTIVELQDLMSDAAGRAIELDPALVLAKTYHDSSTRRSDMRWRTIDGFKRAVRDRPNDPMVLEGLTFLLTEFGYLDEALKDAARLHELDPLWALANTHLPITLYAAGHAEEAVAALEFVNRSDFSPQIYRWAIEGLNLVERQDEIAITNVESWLEQNNYPDPTWFRELVTNGRDPVTGQAYLDRRIPEIVTALAEVDDIDWHNGLISLYLFFGYLDRYYELVLDDEPVSDKWHDAGHHMWRSAIFRRLGSTKHPMYVELAELLGFIEIWEQGGPPDFCKKVEGEWICE